MTITRRPCAECAEFKRCRQSAASYVFFTVGMVSTLSIRLVTVLIHVKPAYGQIAWYVGVVGFFAYFVYKYRVERARNAVVQERCLMDKVLDEDRLSREDREAIGSILCGLSSRKDTINYLFIFASSAVTLAVAVYFDFVARFLAR